MLAELALHGETAVTNPAWRYSPAIVSLIGTQLGIIEDEDPDATAGGRQTSVADRLASLDLLHTRISRARYHYCAASDELDSTKELAKISFQPRRPANGASTSVPAVTPPAPTP